MTKFGQATLHSTCLWKDGARQSWHNNSYTPVPQRFTRVPKDCKMQAVHTPRHSTPTPQAKEERSLDEVPTRRTIKVVVLPAEENNFCS